MADLDAHAKPPVAIKDIYKRFQKYNGNALDYPDLAILDEAAGSASTHLKSSSVVQLPDELRKVFLDFLGEVGVAAATGNSHAVFESNSVPGLYIYPSLLPQQVQLALLNKLFHRDLCNPEHKTNIHAHYDVPYPSSHRGQPEPSYFESSATELTFQPKDSIVHRPITVHHYLDKKLRWMTIGGQYDWTRKKYLAGDPPPFPQDIRDLIEQTFPMKAEAAIVNLYSPGDTLSLHRDVSEECNQPLVSLSLGCDGIFVVGLDEADENGQPKVASIRLRSGDAVLMSGESRYAWHGVPKVLDGTCPTWMHDWPCVDADRDSNDDSRFEHWRGWMGSKRINLNVRQMFA